MLAIWKYELVFWDRRCDLELPMGAEVIRMDQMDGAAYIWALCETKKDHPKEKRYFRYFETGESLGTSDGGELLMGYMGLLTKRILGSPYVMHVFEVFDGKDGGDANEGEEA